MRRFFLLSLAAFFAFSTGIPADDKPCYALLADDTALLDALPTRLRSIVDSAHFHTLLTNDEQTWKPFRDALDAGLANPGKPFKVTVGDLNATMKFDRDSQGGLRLWINPLAKNGSRRLPFFPAGKIDGLQFVNFIGAELGWIAKARADGTLKEGVNIIGEELRNQRMIDLVGTLGFKRGRIAGPECYIFGLVGVGAGLGAGIGRGKLYFAKYDSSVQNGTIEEEGRKFYRDILFGSAGGAVVGTGVAALACFKFSGRNYSLEFNPEAIVKNPADRPPGNIPPIDQIPADPIPAGDVVPADQVLQAPVKKPLAPLLDEAPPQLGDPGIR